MELAGSQQQPRAGLVHRMEDEKTEKNQFVLKLCCVYSKSRGGSASAQVPVGIPGAQGGDGRTIPNPDNALLSFNMEKSEYHPLIIGVFAVFTGSKSRSRSFRNIMSFGSPKTCCEQSKGAFIKSILANYLLS